MSYVKLTKMNFRYSSNILVLYNYLTLQPYVQLTNVTSTTSRSYGISPFRKTFWLCL